METYLVGGAVRDQLLKLPVHEYDWVVVGATPDQLLSQGYQQVGKDFPVFLHPKTHEEYALARTERKSGTGYTGFACYTDPSISLEEDLLRRDLTINAIAQDKQGNLYDPYGGRHDLEQRILRHVSPAFSEDPLRVLRLARFAAKLAPLGFTIAPETERLIKAMVISGELADLTAERVWKETEKALKTAQPARYFEVLRDCGALAVLFPEIDRLFGVPAPIKWHPEIDTGIHTLMTLNEAAKLSDNLSVRFAALCHDLGKGVTPKQYWPSHHGHGVAGIPLIKTLAKRLRIPSALRDFALIAAEYHDLVHTVYQLKSKTIIKLFDALGAWRDQEQLNRLILVSTADAKGREGWQNKPYPQAAYLHELFHIANEVAVQSVITDGYTGGEIKLELQRRRINKLNEYLLFSSKSPIN